MYLIDRLIRRRESARPEPVSSPAIEPAPRRLLVRRTVRLGRSGMAPWQKIGTVGRSSRH